MVLAAARGTVDDLLTTVFPADCRVCDEPLVRASSVPVCDTCLGRVRPQKGSLCEVCGESLGFESERFREGYGAEARVCTPCRRVPPAFERATAYGVYERELREMLHLLKYDGVRRLAGPLGLMLAEAIELLWIDGSTAPAQLLVVAVPLYRTRRRSRGFNHAEVLADAAARALRRRRPELRLRSVHGLLERVRETESQFGLTPQARRRNLRGAFAVAEAERVRDQDVLLIDDIYTTGATARACAGVLRQAGARRVLVATLARAQPERVAMWDAGLQRAAVRFQGSGLGAEVLGDAVGKDA